MNEMSGGDEVFPHVFVILCIFHKLCIFYKLSIFSERPSKESSPTFPFLDDLILD